MFPSDQLRALLEAGETRRIEYKDGQPWSDNAFKARVTKTILAMSNVKDGGRIVIGVTEQANGSFVARGVNQHDLETYVSDEMKDFVGTFADPHVDFSVDTGEHDGKHFIVITVREFEEIPVICKKDFGQILRRGDIYTRTRDRRPESARVSNHADMREIIELATDKTQRKLRERGYVLKLQRSDKKLFDEELESLNE